MSLYLVLFLIFLVTALMAWLVFWLLARRYDPVIRKMKQLQQISGDPNLRAADRLTPSATVKRKIKSNLEKALSSLSQFAQRDEQYDSKLRRSLMQAGFYQENSVSIYVSLKIVGAVILFFGYGFLGLLAGRSGPSIFLVAAAMACMGYVLPSFGLNAMIRRREEAISGALPDALDFLVICVEAGLGLNSAIIRVGQEMQLRSKALGEELVLINQEMRTGASREQAFRHLTQRVPIDDLRILVSALILADKLGTNIADTLRAQSDSLRTRVRQRAEERAAKAGLKMLFPLVFCILPALFIVILGPGVILIAKTLLPLMP